MCCLKLENSFTALILLSAVTFTIQQGNSLQGMWGGIREEQILGVHSYNKTIYMFME